MAAQQQVREVTSDNIRMPSRCCIAYTVVALIVPCALQHSRVMNMIEIEVEMDIEVPAAEVAGIQQQMDRLIELESVAEDWRAQAEARDEVGIGGRVAG